MGKLMKYEFRKTMFSKIVLLVITGVLEIVFLAGVFLNWDNGLGLGTIGLTLCAIIGIFYIGIESLMVFHRDLNTKQSYMLFLTPYNSYQILGAKVLENGISIFLAGCFYAALAALDLAIAIGYLGGLKELLEMIQIFLEQLEITITFTTVDSLLFVFEILASWLMTVVTGILAVVLSATVLAGKRFSGLVSFLLFFLIAWGCSALMNRIPDTLAVTTFYLLSILAALACTAVMYLISGWIMERKLSV
ncbi:MAG: hypothetical protein LUI14_11160 [Lachnospiraceae bacterium]|nr:hypothetical protein [Lachnospiraceae bacterium]